MEHNPISDPIDDPFLDAVRRRHPDVDIVVLPPEAPPAVGEPVPDDVVAVSLIRVATQARQLWASIAPDSTDATEARFGYGSGPGTVRALSRVATRRDDGYHLLVALRHDLESDGWEVTRPEGLVERLIGHLDDLTISASYAEGSGALILELSSESLPVGEHRARELTRPAGGGR